MTNPQHPRTQDGPRYPERDCEGTAEQVLGVSEAEAHRLANELSESAEDHYGDGDLGD
jgi:hypothetical protein